MSRSLSDAVRSGNIAEVQIRLNMGEDRDQADPPLYRSALHWAVACGHLDIAQLLVSRGAGVDIGDRDGGTPLALAKRDQKTEFVELLLRAGSRVTSSPCTSPFPELGTDPLLRDSPPWSVSNIKQYLDTPSEGVAVGGGQQSALAQQHGAKDFKSFFKSKKKESQEEEPKQPVSKENSSECPKTKESTVKSFMSNVIKTKQKCVEESVEADERPLSQASMAASYKSSDSKGYEFNTQKHEDDLDNGEAATDEAQVSDAIQDGQPKPGNSQSLKTKCSAGKLYLSNLVKVKEEQWPQSIKKKRLAVNLYFAELKKKKTKEEDGQEQECKSQTSAGNTSVKGDMATVFCTKTEDIKTISEKESENENSNVSTNILKFFKINGTTVNNFKFNIMKSKKETEVVVNEAETSTHPTAETPGLPIVDTPIQSTAETPWKKKCTSAKDYVSNSFRSREKEDQQEKTNTEKCIKSETSYWKIPAQSFNINGTTVKNIKSNIMKITKKTREPESNEAKAPIQTSPKKSWKGKCTAAKEHVAKSLKSRTKGDQQETKKKEKSIKLETPTIKEKMGGLFKSKLADKGPDKCKEKVKNTSSSNGLWIKKIDADGNNLENDNFVGRSVKDYVKMYEEKNSSSGYTNTIIQGYARPFKEFNDSSLSEISFQKLECATEKDLTKEKSKETAVSVRGNECIDQKDDETIKEESKKRKWDLQEDFRLISDKMDQKKKLSMEKATRTLSGVRRRAKKWKLVRALRRNKTEETERTDGKIYLKSPRGQSKIYTFRKSSIR